MVSPNAAPGHLLSGNQLFENPSERRFITLRQPSDFSDSANVVGRNLGNTICTRNRRLIEAGFLPVSKEIVMLEV